MLNLIHFVKRNSGVQKRQTDLQRSIFTNQKGGGPAIAVAVIMSMILVVALVQNVYIWGQQLTNESADIAHESIQIQRILITDSGDVAITVNNAGTVNSHLITVWMEGQDPLNMSRRFPINMYVNTEATVTVVLDSTWVSGFNLSAPNVYTVITERGNAASYEYPYDTQPTFPEVYYLGVFGIDWFYCKYSSEQNPPNGSLLADASYISKSDDYVAFYLNVTNLWEYPCALTADSFLALTTAAPPVGEPIFHIVQNVSYDGTPTITTYDDSTPYIFGANESRVLIFASETEEDAGWHWGKGYPFGSETTTDGSDIQICLFYEIYEKDGITPTGQNYGQTISSHAVTLMKK